jgi:hypothetical protein
MNHNQDNRAELNTMRASGGILEVQPQMGICEHSTSPTALNIIIPCSSSALDVT